MLGLYKNYFHWIQLNGMGFKGLVIRNKKLLVLKLGFSHKIIFKEKLGIAVTYKQRRLFKLVGRDDYIIKSIVYSFKNLQKANAYKKKGVYLKGSILGFKISSKKAKF